MQRDEASAGLGTPNRAVVVTEMEATQEAARYAQPRDKSPQEVASRPAGMVFSPTKSLAWVLGLLGVGACVAPLLMSGWLWFELIAATVAILLCYDALGVWLARQECAPVLFAPEDGLRGREGQTIQLPLAITGSGRRRLRSEIRVALMPASERSEAAIRMSDEPQRLKLEWPSPSIAPAAASGVTRLRWPWKPEITLLQRGVWPAPRVGIERRSSLGLWVLRQWFDLPGGLRVDADLQSGRREILRSPVYRALVASRQTPWSGHGRDFERLREYQPGDTYSEVAWKSTARRGAPVTRVFQWEQKQEVYFVVDQSRASALAIDPVGELERHAAGVPAPRRLLDLAVETALVGATVALELGDEFGLITYADEPTSWLRAGSGQSHFCQLRDRVRKLEPLPTNADYEALFGAIRLRLRRRAYLVLLADLTERSVSESLLRGLGLVRTSHAALVTSILPDHARPAFSPGDEPQTEQAVYAALAGEKENQRLDALTRKLRQLDVQLRFVPAEKFLWAAVEGYLESKREQRL